MEKKVEKDFFSHVRDKGVCVCVRARARVCACVCVGISFWGVFFENALFPQPS